MVQTASGPFAFGAGKHCAVFNNDIFLFQNDIIFQKGMPWLELF